MKVQEFYTSEVLKKKKKKLCFVDMLINKFINYAGADLYPTNNYLRIRGSKY
jgi:hypothetical protein